MDIVYGWSLKKALKFKIGRPRPELQIFYCIELVVECGNTVIWFLFIP